MTLFQNQLRTPQQFEKQKHYSTFIEKDSQLVLPVDEVNTTSTNDNHHKQDQFHL